MILKAGDANKYSRNGIAYAHFKRCMEDISFQVVQGNTRYYRDVSTMDELVIAKLAEWLIEKGYTLTRSDNKLCIDWERAT